MKIKKYLNIGVILLSLLILTSCSALHTAVSKRNLEISTKMSNTIWLNPVSPSEKTIFVQIRNTSGKDLMIENKIIGSIQQKGYKVVDDPKLAKFWLQANVLKVDKVNLRELNDNGIPDGFLAGGIGALLGAQRSGGIYTAIGWGLAAAAATTVTDAMITDINYIMVTDILITEKTDEVVKYENRNVIHQGKNGKRTSYSSGVTNTEKYSTKVLSIANKRNLKFEEATPALEDELVKVISGIF